MAGNVASIPTDVLDGPAEKDGVPMHDGAAHKVEARGAGRLAVKGFVAKVAPLAK